MGGGVEGLDHLDARVTNVIGQRNLAEESLRYTLQGILGPFGEPIDRGAVDETREVPASVPECIANRTEANNQVQTLLASLDKEGKQLLGSSLWTSVLFLCRCPDRVLDLCFLVGREDVRYLASVEDVVDVLKEALLFHTVVSEYEASGFASAAHVSHESLQVLPELYSTIYFLDLDLEDFKICDLRSES